MDMDVYFLEFVLGIVLGGGFFGVIGYGIGHNRALREAREIMRECEQDHALLRHIERYPDL